MDIRNRRMNTFTDKAKLESERLARYNSVIKNILKKYDSTLSQEIEDLCNLVRRVYVDGCVQGEKDALELVIKYQNEQENI